ncbi:MAG: hypothetical protein KDA83_21230 [Planctomycetales bacterium]|nr:hypothetical protein [Planctomycetales bacterium]
MRVLFERSQSDPCLAQLHFNRAVPFLPFVRDGRFGVQRELPGIFRGIDLARSSRDMARINNGWFPTELVHPVETYRTLLTNLTLCVPGLVELASASSYQWTLRGAKLFSLEAAGESAARFTVDVLFPEQHFKFESPVSEHSRDWEREVDDMLNGLSASDS